MSRLLKRIRGALGMGLTWAAGWAVFGLLIGISSRILPFIPWDAFFEVFDAPLPALAVPGFVGGVLFSIVLGTLGNRRSFSELSLAKFTAWGAVGGVLLSLVPAAMVGVGLASLGGEGGPSLLQLTATIMVPLTALCAGSAAGSLWIARRAQNRELLEAKAKLGLSEGASRDSFTRSASDRHRAGV